MLKMTMLAGVGAMTMALAAVPAMAQAVQVYSNQSLFDSQRPGITTNTFSFPVNPPNPTTGTADSGTTVTSPYTYKGVTFSSQYLTGLNDGFYGAGVSYLSDFQNGSAPNYNYATNFTIVFNGPVLGLTFNYQDDMSAHILTYTVNGQQHSVTPPADISNFFLGFDTGKANSSVTVNFTNLTSTNELDIVGFQTAVPEAATWAMMMVGLGVVGGAVRRRQKVSTRVSFA